ncbi:MAG: PHP domain-containing protein [Ignavibacteriaceae bacterium]|nr:PHP domain-containing protein [Ignavibacteriaceae bacterium]
MPGKKEIAALLESIADLMEYKGENQFKVNAFRNGADAIKKYGAAIGLAVKNKSLNEIKGIGNSLQAVIYEFCETGISSLYEELKKDVPEGINDLLKIRGLGPKKIQILFTELGISNIGELEYACKENRLALLKGFGEASQAKIIDAIEKFKTYSKYILLSTADIISEEILERVSRFKYLNKIVHTGQLRRGMEIISEIAFVALATDKKKFLAELKKEFEYTEQEDKIIIQNGYPVPVVLFIVASEEEYCRQLFLTTGSEEFIQGINAVENIKYSGNEHSIFESINFPYVIPEMREREYFEQTNVKLKENSDLSIDHFKGLLHFHTTYSDARNTLKEMIAEAQKEGFEYAAVCDHSKFAVYANGLNEERVLLQKKEIKEIASGYNVHIFHGVESDILPNGDLDYSKDFLANFDFIAASIHSRFNMEEAEMTKRLIKAVENPYTDMLAHPSGRLLLSREPYKFDVKKVIDACATNNVAIEINANPHRLDLDWRRIYYAREKGCMFSINPDAHSVEDISYIKYGIITARKGGVKYSEVINCFALDNFKKFLNRKVKRDLN